MSGDMLPPSDLFKPPLSIVKSKSESRTKDERSKNGDSKEKDDPCQADNHSSTPVQNKNGKRMYPPQACPYDEPSWGGKPTDGYELNVVKEGTMLPSIALNKSFITIGRHQDCDVVLDNPSISRFHAVLQFRQVAENDREKSANLQGFYLYDLGSTHGTKLNRNPMDPKSYKRVNVGHHLKFGLSTRTYIIDGPDGDAEAEDEMSVTDIVKLRKQRELEFKLRKEGNSEGHEASEKSSDNGINWGMGDDAEETEETISEVNPFSLGDSSSEQLYLEDPKKTLRGWFEREGYELEYKVEDKGLSQFLCRIELPIDTGDGHSVVAEAVVKGKKKEAVIQCALEACRILDRNGELRKAQHESRKRKSRNWKEDDYLDSDEDEFLDRTGDLEAKKNRRKARIEKNDLVETYQSLTEKLSDITGRIKEINKCLEASKQSEQDGGKTGNDSLEAFMKQLKSGAALDKAKRSQLRLELAKLMPERLRIIKLINIAKPAELPPLKLSTNDPDLPSSSLKKVSPIVGSIKGLKRRAVLPLVGLPAKLAEKNELDAVSSNREEIDTEEVEEEADQIEEDHVGSKTELTEGGMCSEKPPQTTSEEKSCQPVADPSECSRDGRKNPETPMERDTSTSLSDEHGPVKFKQIDRHRNKPPPSQPTKVRNLKPSKTPFANRKATLNAPTSKAILKTVGSDDFEDWVPPKNQSGDGTTHLNEKFGY